VGEGGREERQIEDGERQRVGGRNEEGNRGKGGDKEIERRERIK